MDTLPRIVIFGAGQIAQVIFDCFKREGKVEAVCFVVNPEFLTEESLFGLPIISSADVEDMYPSDEFGMFVAVGYSGMNSRRAEICAWARGCGYKLHSFISPRATTFPDLVVGDNCLVLEDNTIQQFVTLGDNVFLWSGNHVGHHSRIGDNVFVSSHCVISGNCQIGMNSFLGVNCTLQDNVTLGEACFIGAASLVRTDLSAESVVIQSATPVQKVKSKFLRIGTI